MSDRSQRPHAADARTSCSHAWERAYAAFETPEQARDKILRRLRRFGAERWDRGAAVVELCCGSGAGLAALTQMGFGDVEGIDLSADLVGLYDGPARCRVADCRDLPFERASKDVVIVHGGLHHLATLEDIERTLREACRVSKPGGRFCCVEPWSTPFLRLVRTVSENPLARRVSKKLDAFQTMVDHELATYEHWLSRPEEIRALLARHFVPIVERRAWGSLTFVGERLEHRADD